MKYLCTTTMVSLESSTPPHTTTAILEGHGVDAWAWSEAYAHREFVAFTESAKALLAAEEGFPWETCDSAARYFTMSSSYGDDYLEFSARPLDSFTAYTPTIFAQSLLKKYIQDIHEKRAAEDEAHRVRMAKRAEIANNDALWFNAVPHKKGTDWVITGGPLVSTDLMYEGMPALYTFGCWDETDPAEIIRKTRKHLGRVG